jgi:hypothetical protein
MDLFAVVDQVIELLRSRGSRRWKPSWPGFWKRRAAARAVAQLGTVVGRELRHF